MEKMIPGLIALTLVISVAAYLQGSTHPQGSGGSGPGATGSEGGKTGKQDRLEGIVVRTSKDQSSLTIRKRGSNMETIIRYDSSTQWISQQHGNTKVDASQVKDADRVIVWGKYDDKGVLHASTISIRGEAR